MKDGRALKNPEGAQGASVTRRELIAGIATVAAVAVMPSALAQATAEVKPSRIPRRKRAHAVSSVLRVMAGAVSFADGRILVAGGYDRLPSEKHPSTALTSTQIFDPVTGVWTSAAPMSIGRVRHAMVLLPDGRVAAIGGMSASPLASTEVYDPARDVWTTGPSLAQPRFDHTAVAYGTDLIVMGGSSASVILGVEIVSMDRRKRPTRSLNDTHMPIFLKIPSIPGDVVVKGFEQQLDVSNLNWGVGTESVLRGTGISLGKPAFSRVAITLGSGRWSARLMFAAAASTTFDDMLITVVSTGVQEVPRILHEVTLKGARLVAYNLSAESSPTCFDAIELVFSQIEFKSYGYDSQGNQNSFNRATWNVLSNSGTIAP